MTNDTKAKIFYQYHGVKYFITNKLGSKYCGLVGDYDTEKDIKSNYFRLILKPLSLITDNDAIRLSIINPINIIPRLEKDIKHLIECGKSTARIISDISGYNSYSKPYYFIACCDFLRSKGYDIPNYHLGGKTLHEAGLAIYEHELK